MAHWIYKLFGAFERENASVMTRQIDNHGFVGVYH